MPRIKDVLARKVFDSRGVETLEVEIVTENGFGRVAAPFGAPGSRGEFEAPAYSPGGIDKSLEIIETEVTPKLLGLAVTDQEKLDSILREIDGTSNFARMGGNTSSVISLAVAKAAASALKIPLYMHLALDNRFAFPYPLGNMIGGGAHSMGAAPDMQEHLVVPVGARNIREAVTVNLAVHERVGEALEAKDSSFVGGMDDERAWVANLTDVEALDIIYDVCREVTANTGIRLRLGLDLAADRLWNPESEEYEYHREGKSRTTEEQIEFLSSLIAKYDLFYVEDAFNSNDYSAFALLNEKYGKQCLICGDDLFASNLERVKNGMKIGCANAMVLKPNQVGTLTSLRETFEVARQNRIKAVISHRSGETCDTSIAHIGVGWQLPMIKTGVLGGERLAKLNELLRVTEDYPMAKLN